MVDGIRGVLNLCSLLCVLLRLLLSTERQGNLGVLGIANANGDCASWSRHAGNLRANFSACRHEQPNRIRRRLSAIGRYLESTDYVGQASRCYQISRLLAIGYMWLRIVTL